MMPSKNIYDRSRSLWGCIEKVSDASILPNFLSSYLKGGDGLQMSLHHLFYSIERIEKVRVILEVYGFKYISLVAT